MRDRNLQIVTLFLSLLSVVALAGRIPSHHQASMKSADGLKSDGTAVHRDFATVVWTNGAIRGYVRVERSALAPRGWTYLYLQLIYEDTGKLIQKGHGYIPDDCLVWEDDKTLHLKTDTRFQPRFKMAGPAETLDLRWSIKKIEEDSHEGTNVEVNGEAMGMTLSHIQGASLERSF
jgi:hypothetical protein